MHVHLAYSLTLSTNQDIFVIIIIYTILSSSTNLCHKVLAIARLHAPLFLDESK